MALTDAEYAEMQQLASSSGVDPALKARAQKALDQRPHEQAAAQMDPSLPLLPQALAMQPATTHPEGDQKAQEEWISDPQKASLTGAKYVYEPPIAIARQDLANPDMARLVNPHADGSPVSPEELSGMTEDSPLYQAYADYKWRQTADEAAKNGITAYRYAKAPWLHSDNGMGTLQTLAMKLAGSAVPLMNIKDAFVMGADKSIAAGAGRRVQEKLDDTFGNSTGESARTENARNESEHSGTVAAGGVLGALSGWGSAAKAYELATGARALAPLAAEGAGVLSRAAGGLIGGAAGGALAQGAEEGVNTAANAMEGAPAASSVPEGAAGRIEGSAIGGGVLGGIAGALGGIAGAARRYIGGRHGGAVNEFERAGGQITSAGPVPAPAVAAAEAEGARAGVDPVDLHASKLAPKIEESTSGHVENTIGGTHDENAAYYATPEGQQKLPMTNLVGKAVDLVREKSYTNPDTGSLSDLANNGPNGAVRGVLNHAVSEVSTKPVPGAVPVSPAEAEHLLDPYHKDNLVSQLSGRSTGEGAAGASSKVLDPQKVKDLRTNGDAAASKLSKEELDAVQSYTSRRGEKVGTPAWNSATRKLRIENPTDAGPLYHGTRMPSDEIAKVLDDGSFAMNRPTSLSFNKDLSDAFATAREGRGEKVMFEVHQLNEGTNLLSPKVGIGRSGLEREINVSKPTTFDVVGHHVDEDGVTHIELAQKPKARAESGKGSLRDALDSAGVDKVYLVPKRYDASEMQGTAGTLRDMSPKNSTDPGRDAFSKLHAAVLQDRDARTLNGVAGGWGAQKGAQSAALGAAKTERRLAMPPSVGKPQGDAFQPLTQYANQARGQYPLTQALRASAERAGVTPELEQLRQLGVLSNLRGMANFGNSGGTTRSPRALGPLIDAASIRAYPALKALAGPINPVHLAAGSQLLNAGERAAEEDK